MNDVLNLNQNTISSLEVAQMIEQEHKELLKRIRRFTNQLNEGKISPVDFWTESTYSDSKGENRICFLITKKGCEFIAHKTTGAKGAAFTARYINRFHEMEEKIKKELIQGSEIDMSKALVKNKSKTWYEKNQWKMKVICDCFGWERKYLYHKMLTELSEVYNMEFFEEMFVKETGKVLKYKIQLIEFYPMMQDIANRYLDFLLGNTGE